MAQTEPGCGQNADATALAHSIITSHSAEIAELSLNTQALDLAQWIRSSRTVQWGQIEALARRLP